jgi:hypothetical protein
MVGFGLVTENAIVPNSGELKTIRHKELFGILVRKTLIDLATTGGRDFAVMLSHFC